MPCIPRPQTRDRKTDSTLPQYGAKVTFRDRGRDPAAARPRSGSAPRPRPRPGARGARPRPDRRALVRDVEDHEHHEARDEQDDDDAGDRIPHAGRLPMALTRQTARARRRPHDDRVRSLLEMSAVSARIRPSGSGPDPAPPQTASGGAQDGEARAPRAEEDRRLLIRYHRHGDEAARGALVEGLLPLARRMVRGSRRSDEPLDDLVQVATLGLIKAIDRFDPARETAFSSYAVPTMLGELKRYFR